MDTLTYADLDAACRAGGSTCLSSITDLVPAAGPHAGIAPARYTTGKGRSSKGVYDFEPRYIDGEARDTVLVDGKASQLNRIESAVAAAIRAGDPALAGMPSIRVTYYRDDDPDLTFFDYQLPHRYTDAHIRVGTHDGKPVIECPDYIAARNAGPADATALLALSPLSLALGSWDSTRGSHQNRYRSTAVGEIIGVLADQTGRGRHPGHRGAARTDTVASGVHLTGPETLGVLDVQKAWMSKSTVDEITKKATAAKKGEKLSASKFGLGSIPPNLEALGLVSCSQIIRSHVLSFAALRQIRFGDDEEATVACRALLAALVLHGIALSDEELALRANCDLREAGPAHVELDTRHGTHRDLAQLKPEVTGPMLQAAVETARTTAGITWDGRIFEVTGNPIVLGGMTAEADDDAQKES